MTNMRRRLHETDLVALQSLSPGLDHHRVLLKLSLTGEGPQTVVGLYANANKDMDNLQSIILSAGQDLINRALALHREECAVVWAGSLGNESSISAVCEFKSSLETSIIRS
jgi:hypothetical protein